MSVARPVSYQLLRPIKWENGVDFGGLFWWCDRSPNGADKVERWWCFWWCDKGPKGAGESKKENRGIKRVKNS